MIEKRKKRIELLIQFDYLYNQIITEKDHHIISSKIVQFYHIILNSTLMIIILEKFCSTLHTLVTWFLTCLMSVICLS